MKKIQKMKWETEISYNYRIETGVLLVSLSSILGKVNNKITAEEAKNLYNLLITERNKLKSLKVPEMYNKVQECLFNCVQAYILGLNELYIGLSKKNSKIIYKSGRHIEEGNLWMGLAKIKVFDAIEEKI